MSLGRSVLVLVLPFLFGPGPTLLCGQAGLDGDGNGVSEVWEACYALLGPSPEVDTDGDGRSDFDEAREGTDPRDGASVFRLTIELASARRPFVAWQSKQGKRYQVQGSIGDGNWLDLPGEVDGNGGLVGYADPGGGFRPSIYRVAVVDEPMLPEAEAELSARDTDGDGQSDWVEWRSGSSLVDPGETFGIESVESKDAVTLAWMGVRGMRYRLQAQEAGEWADLGGAIDGAGRTCRVSVPAPVRTTLYRVAAEAPDTDGDGLADWEEHLAGLDPEHLHTLEADKTDAEVVARDLASGGTLTLEAVAPVVTAGSGGQGAVRLRRERGFARLDVPLRISGVAVPGSDYEAIPPVVTLPFGVRELVLPVRTLPNPEAGATKRVEIALADPSGWQPGACTERGVTLLVENLINVRDHGATGDGVTDDTAALQRAIEALEASGEHNGLFFPPGTYRLATVTKHWTAGVPGNYCLLRLGANRDLAGRDLVFKGAPGAVLYSDASPLRVNMLLCPATFRSLVFRGLCFEKEPAPLSATPNSEPNGADGVTVVAQGTRRVEQVAFRDCTFTNCHRSVSLHGTGYDIRGFCGSVWFQDCRVLNPYGSNTFNGTNVMGGGQQIYIPPWVAEARYEGCLFEGGGVDMTDEATCPSGKLKDGCHFGSPLRLVFRDNVVRRMGIEAVYQTNDNTLMGYTASSFTMPPADGVTETSVTVSDTLSTWVAGDTIVVRRPGMSSNDIMTVGRFDPATRTLWMTSQPNAGNSPEGTVNSLSRAIYRDQCSEPTLAVIEGNVVDGRIPPGGRAADGPMGICVNAKARIARNYVRDHGWGICGWGEVHTSLHPATTGTVMRDNVVVARDPMEYPAVYTTGIGTAGDRTLVAANYIISPISYKFAGIRVDGLETRVTANMISALNIVRNGYTSPVKSVGIGLLSNAGNASVKANSTRGFDIGVGPAALGVKIPFWAYEHTSVLDVVGVDPRGLLNP